MIDIEINLPANFLAEEVAKVEAQSVRVGYGASAGSPDWATRIPSNKHAKGLPNGVSGGAGMTRRAIKRGKYGELKVTELAKILDKKYKFLSDPFIGASNIYVKEMAEEFALMLDPENRIHTRRIENAGIALIRNAVLQKDYGSNSKETTKAKGFDHPMIDTGSTISRLEAKYYEVDI